MIMFASLLAALGGGAQQTVGQLAEKLSNSPVIPILVVLTSALTAFTMTYFGAWLSSPFIGLPRAVIVAGALTLSTIALFRNVPITPIREPTLSIGATFLALLGKQALDAPRWLAFAAAAAITEPLGIALGATFGSAIALLVAWMVPEVRQFATKFRLARIVLAAIVLTLAAFAVWIGATSGG